MVFFVLPFIFILFAVYLLMFDNSYKNAIEAKYYYSTGKYKKAYELSKTVYKNNSYNTMALTVMTKSEIAISYKKYIEDGKKYLQEIKNIKKGGLKNKKELVKIKMICEVMIGEYKELKRSMLNNKELSEKAKKIYDKFRKIYDDLFKKRG